MSHFTIYEARKRGHPTKKEYHSVGQKFGSAYHWHYTVYFHGYRFRDGRSEEVLREGAKKGDWHAQKYINNRVVYTVRRLSRKPATWETIEARIAKTEGVVRFHLADPTAVYLWERDFVGARPEFGYRFPKGDLLFEFQSYHNTLQEYKHKVQAYKRAPGVVLFVCAVDRGMMERYIKKYPGDYYATDYETFLSVPYGEQISAPIYFWGGDGTAHSLQGE